DHLPLPHHAHCTQVVTQTALGCLHPDELPQVDRRRRHQRLPEATMRIHCWLPSPDSASRIVVPVCDMNTSSNEGLDTLTDRIGTPSSAKSRGTNSSPAGTENITWPSAIFPVMPNWSCKASNAASSSAVVICTRSSPTAALSASGVSRTTIRPLSMIL